MENPSPRYSVPERRIFFSNMVEGMQSRRNYISEMNDLSPRSDPEILGREVFDTVVEAKMLVIRWRQEYNLVRPHSSLGYRPPAPEVITPMRA